MFRNFIYIKYVTSRYSVVTKTVFNNGLNQKFALCNRQIALFSSAVTVEKDVVQNDKFGSLIDDVINFNPNKTNVESLFAKKMDVGSVRELYEVSFTQILK